MAEINWKNKCWVTTIYLVRQDGSVLLTWNKNLQTQIPVGGHIEPGETPEEATTREVAEETGFEFEFLNAPTTADSGRLKILKPQHIQIESVPHHGHHMNFVFVGKCLKWTDKSETDEQEQLRWFSRQELEGMRGKMLDSVLDNSLSAIGAVHNSHTL